MVVVTCRAQWSKDLDHCPGSPQEVRSEEDLEGHQEEVRYVVAAFVVALSLCRYGHDADSGLACNGTIVNDTEMGEVIQLQGDQRKDVQEFLTDKKEGLELDAKTIKVRLSRRVSLSPCQESVTDPQLRCTGSNHMAHPSRSRSLSAGNPCRRINQGFGSWIPGLVHVPLP